MSRQRKRKHVEVEEGQVVICEEPVEEVVLETREQPAKDCNCEPSVKQNGLCPHGG